MPTPTPSRASILATLLTCCCLLGAAERPPENAALSYWIATTLVPTPDSPAAAMLKRWEAGIYPFVDESGVPVLTIPGPVNEEILDLLRHGATIPACRFRNNGDGDPGASLGHLTSLRQMTRYAQLAAAHACESGEPERAVEWLAATAAMARHLATDANLIEYFVAVSCLTGVQGTATRLAPRLPSKERLELAQRLEAMLPWPPLAPVLRTETDFQRWYRQHLSENPDLFTAARKQMENAQDPNQAKTLDESVRIFLTADIPELLTWIDALTAATETLAAQIDGPQSAIAMENFEKSCQNNPFSFLVPAVKHLSRRRQNTADLILVSARILRASNPGDPTELQQAESPITRPLKVTLADGGVIKVRAEQDAEHSELRLDVGLNLKGSPTVPPEVTGRRKTPSELFLESLTTMSQ